MKETEAKASAITKTRFSTKVRGNIESSVHRDFNKRTSITYTVSELLKNTLVMHGLGNLQKENETNEE